MLCLVYFNYFKFMTELRKKMMYYLEAWELTERLIKSGRLYPQSEMRIEWGSDHYF